MSLFTSAYFPTWTENAGVLGLGRAKMHSLPFSSLFLAASVRKEDIPQDSASLAQQLISHAKRASSPAGWP